MASSYSLINDYSNLTLYTPDYNLLQTALQYKQGKLDQNRAKLQQVRDQFGALDVVKDGDQQYLDNRLQKITEITNKYAGLDLSSDALTNSLVGNMNQVIDANVKTAVVSTKRLRNEQKEWEDKRKNKPDQYSDLNYAFAMQKANKWVNDGATGSSYSGGGGFVEYRDVNKKIQDALPKAIELIKSKRAQEVSSGQAIGGIATIETVDRGMLSEAIDSMLDEKDKLQLRINAWGQYDTIPDEQLRDMFDEKQAPKIKEANSNISTIESLLKTTKSQSEKESLTKTLNAWKGRKEELDDLTFENYVGEGGAGKDNLYTSLYIDDFKGGFLNAYSYGDRITELKVNEIQKANKEYQLKIAEYGIKKAEFSEKLRKNRVDEAYKEAELKLKYGQGDGTGANGWQPAGDSDNPIDTEASTKGGFDSHQAYLRGLDGTVRKSLKSKLGLDDAGVSKLMRNKDFVTQLKSGSLAGKNEINIGGKTVKLDANLKKQLLDYKDEFLETPEVKKEAFNDVESMMTTVRKNYREGISSGNASFDNLPNYNIKYKKVNGAYTIVKRTGNEVSSANRYAYLLKMEKSGKLTETDKRDLKLYSTLHLMNDPTVSQSQSSLLKEYIQYTLLGDVDQAGYKNVSLKVSNGFGAIIPNSATKSGVKDIWISNIAKGDIQGNAVTNMFNSVAKTIIPDLYTDEELKQTQKGSGFRTYATDRVGLDRVIQDNFSNIDKKLDKAYSPKRNLIKMGKVTLNKDANETYYKKLAGALTWDISGKGSGNNIFIEPDKTEDGKVTGNFVISRPYTPTSSKDTRTSDRKVVTPQELSTYGIPQLVGLNKEKYNANDGKYARKLSLGNGTYTEDGWDAGLPEDYRSPLLQNASQNPQILSETKRILADYKRGDLEVKLEPVNYGGKNIYAYRLYRDGKTALKGIPFPVNDAYMTDDGVSKLLDNPKPFADEAFANILEQYQTYLYND
jgi:hypothetical protein